MHYAVVWRLFWLHIPTKTIFSKTFSKETAAHRVSFAKHFVVLSFVFVFHKKSSCLKFNVQFMNLWHFYGNWELGKTKKRKDDITYNLCLWYEPLYTSISLLTKFEQFWVINVLFKSQKHFYVINLSKLRLFL